MNLNTTTTGAASAFSLPANPPAALVWLTGIVGELGKLYVSLTDGRRYWFFRCSTEQLQTFVAFQARAAEFCGVWINHASQHRVGARTRAESWDETVRVALERGQEI